MWLTRTATVIASPHRMRPIYFVQQHLQIRPSAKMCWILLQQSYPQEWWPQEWILQRGSMPLLVWFAMTGREGLRCIMLDSSVHDTWRNCCRSRTEQRCNSHHYTGSLRRTKAFWSNLTTMTMVANGAYTWNLEGRHGAKSFLTKIRYKRGNLDQFWRSSRRHWWLVVVLMDFFRQTCCTTWDDQTSRDKSRFAEAWLTQFEIGAPAHINSL